MKHLLLTTALITATGTSAVFAEAHSGATADAQMGAETTSTFMSSPESGQIHASDFLGMRIYASAQGSDMTEAEGASEDWEDIGEVGDVVMSRDGQVEAVLVDIGGFLGIGERQVAANLDQITFVSDSSTDEPEDFFLVLNADPATLTDAPEFGAAMSDMGDTMMDETDTAMNTAAEEMDEAGDELADAATATGTAIEEGAEDLAQSAEETANDMAAETEEMASDTADALDPEADVTASAEADATMDEPMSDDVNEMASESGTMNGTPMGDGYMTAENLEGARVYDSNDKWVGEISELVVGADGEITDAIVDVGGFLGIGEKPVALSLSDLQIMQQDGSEEVRIYTAMAEDELKAMPEFSDQ